MASKLQPEIDRFDFAKKVYLETCNRLLSDMEALGYNPQAKAMEQASEFFLKQTMRNHSKATVQALTQEDGTELIQNQDAIRWLTALFRKRIKEVGYLPPNIPGVEIHPLHQPILTDLAQDTIELAMAGEEAKKPNINNQTFTDRLLEKAFKAKVEEERNWLR